MRDTEALVAALRREKGIAKVMRERRLRHLQEDSKAIQRDAQAARDKEATLLEEEHKQEMRKLLLEETQLREEQTAARLQAVDEARRQLALEEELRRKRRLQLEAMHVRCLGAVCEEGQEEGGAV